MRHATCILARLSLLVVDADFHLLLLSLAFESHRIHVLGIALHLRLQSNDLHSRVHPLDHSDQLAAVDVDLFGIAGQRQCASCGLLADDQLGSQTAQCNIDASRALGTSADGRLHHVRVFPYLR